VNQDLFNKNILMLADMQQLESLADIQSFLKKWRSGAGLNLDHVYQLALTLNQYPLTTGIAPLCALGEGLDSRSGFWLRADPCHIQISLQDIYFMSAKEAALDAECAQALAEDLNERLKSEDMRLYCPHPWRWYIHSNQAMKTPAYLPMLDTTRSISMNLLNEETDPQWQWLQNEIQIHLFQHPLNQQRRQQGQADINSLWLWGGAELPRVVKSPWQTIVSDLPLLVGIAKHQGVNLVSPNISAKNLGEFLKNLPEQTLIFLQSQAIDGNLDNNYQETGLNDRQWLEYLLTHDLTKIKFAILTRQQLYTRKAGLLTRWFK